MSVNSITLIDLHYISYDDNNVPYYMLHIECKVVDREDRASVPRDHTFDPVSFPNLQIVLNEMRWLIFAYKCWSE